MKEKNLDDIKAFLKSQYGFDSMLPERKQLREITILVVKRAGRLVAAGIAAVVFRRGIVDDASVAVDGAVYARMKFLHQSITDALLQVFGTNVNIRLILTKDGTGKGAALMAALAAHSEK